MTGPLSTDGTFLVLGRTATLAWTRRSPQSGPGSAGRGYDLSEPLRPGHWTGLYLLAPAALRSFLEMLQEDAADREDWLRFLSTCVIAEGSPGPGSGSLEVWRGRPLIEALTEDSAALELKEIRPGSGPALMPTPRGRVPLETSFLKCLRDGREFFGRAGGGIGRGELFVWAVPSARHMEIRLALMALGGVWDALMLPCKIPKSAPESII